MLHSKYHLNKQPEIGQGTLLISTPVNSFAERSRLLVLITRHNELTGTTGLILNKLIDSELLPLDSELHQKTFDYYYGGPNDPHTVSFMVGFPEMRNGLQDSVYWINDFHDLVILLNMVNTRDVSILAFRGNMKWNAGVLSKEVRQKMWWATNRFNQDDLMSHDKKRWEYYAKKSGGYFAPLVDAAIPIIYS